MSDDDTRNLLNAISLTNQAATMTRHVADGLPEDSDSKSEADACAESLETLVSDLEKSFEDIDYPKLPTPSSGDPHGDASSAHLFLRSSAEFLRKVEAGAAGPLAERAEKEAERLSGLVEELEEPGDAGEEQVEGDPEDDESVESPSG